MIGLRVCGKVTERGRGGAVKKECVSTFVSMYACPHEAVRGVLLKVRERGPIFAAVSDKLRASLR